MKLILDGKELDLTDQQEAALKILLRKFKRNQIINYINYIALAFTSNLLLTFGLSLYLKEPFVLELFCCLAIGFFFAKKIRKTAEEHYAIFIEEVNKIIQL